MISNNAKPVRVHKNPSSFTGQCYGLLRFLSHTQSAGTGILLKGDRDMKGPQQQKPPDINV